MKKFVFCTATLLVQSMILASCNREGNGGTISNEDQQSISIRIAGPQVNGRSVTDPAAEAGQTVVFSDGNLILTKSNGEILYVYNFSSSDPTDVNSSGSTILIADAVITPTNTQGVIIGNLSGDVKKAYIVGNTGSFDAQLKSDYDSALGIGMPISGIQSLDVTPFIQYDVHDKGLAKATLYGEGNVEQSAAAPGDPTQKQVNIDLYPHTARIEIEDITGAGDIIEFHVNGIYINNYYPSMSLNFSPATIVNQGQGGTSVYDHGEAGYITAGIRHDDDKASYFGNALTTLTKVPDGVSDSGEVWAYNILAAPVVPATNPLYSRLGSPTTLAPQVIVQVQNVAVSGDGDYSGMKYITVRRLFEDGTTNEITHFKAGYIYTIPSGQFEFSKENVKDEANLEDMDLEVLVRPITWTVQKMRPDLQ